MYFQMWKAQAKSDINVEKLKSRSFFRSKIKKQKQFFSPKKKWKGKSCKEKAQA